MKINEARKKKHEKGDQDHEEVVYVPQKKWGIKKILVAMIIIIIIAAAVMVAWFLVHKEDETPVEMSLVRNIFSPGSVELEVEFSSPVKVGVKCEVKDSQEKKIKGEVKYLTFQLKSKPKRVDRFFWASEKPLPVGYYTLTVKKRGLEERSFSFNVFEEEKPMEEVTPPVTIEQKPVTPSDGVKASDYDKVQ